MTSGTTVLLKAASQWVQTTKPILIYQHNIALLNACLQQMRIEGDFVIRLGIKSTSTRNVLGQRTLKCEKVPW